MIATEERPMTGGAGFVTLEQVNIDEVMQVLAPKIPCDRNGCDAEYWRKQLEDLDYFCTKTPQMERQELMTLASNPCAGNRQAHDNLCWMLKQAIGDDE